MIPEIGHFALILALAVCATGAVLPLWGSFTHREIWVQYAKYCSWVQFLLIGLSFFCLAYSLLINDFSVIYVAQNSNTALPLIYRFCATWGAHEGSLILWVFILSIWMLLVGIFSKPIPEKIIARVLAVLSLISAGFLLFILTTSNPFLRIIPNVPIQGRDLNPLLQDPGLAIHPPILYMGYVGFSVAFAFAIAALISGRFDTMWAKWARPWTLLAWSFLTFGITLGSWWAYRVLGWGGWWFWDPVENASFLPWLAGTALVHSLMVAEKRNIFKAWTVLLAICAFSLSLMGTFLVRSGILVSVHAFAIDPARGAFMLKFLTVVVGSSLLLYAWRGNRIQGSGIFQFWSRETMLLSNNVLLIVAMLTVLLGTLYPLVIDALGLGKLSVGPPYFNAVFVPIMLPLLLLMGLGPALNWQQSQVHLVLSRLKWSFLLAISLAVIFPLVFTRQLNFAVLIGLLLSFWIILATVQNNLIEQRHSLRFGLKRLGMMVAHVGFAVCVIGIIVSNTYSIERDVKMAPKDAITIGPYEVTFVNIGKLQGPNYQSTQAQLLLKKGQHEIVLRPEMRIFDAQQIVLAKTAIHINPFHDLYIALGENLGSDAWSFRIYYKPFIRWIWFGGIMMMLGGLIAATQRFSRIKT